MTTETEDATKTTETEVKLTLSEIRKTVVNHTDAANKKRAKSIERFLLLVKSTKVLHYSNNLPLDSFEKRKLSQDLTTEDLIVLLSNPAKAVTYEQLGFGNYRLNPAPHWDIILGILFTLEFRLTNLTAFRPLLEKINIVELSTDRA